MVRHHMGLVKRHAKQRSGVRNAVLWKYMAILFAVVFLMVFYLWEQYQVISFDSTIHTLRGEIQEVDDENSRLFVQVVSLSNGQEITARARHDLKMTFPERERVLLIERSPADWTKMHIDLGADQALGFAPEDFSE
ncbi:MAG: cell division protein FtsL [Gemmatimonadota bacterium]|nr:MAG: cell division protein FtsL [Gemmatimonadota bacterium]